KSIDMRISSLPVQHGERIVIRLLDKHGQSFSLDRIGFDEEQITLFREMINKPHGIVLVTGPTGSGKSTTLYSAIEDIKSVETNIMTCEDPIEYELDGIAQSAVNVKAGLTFASQLRAMLRQDPDIILVGEIRDMETATIAFQAAMTGHMIFSTLHCNDTASAITRLTDMGVEPFLIGSSLTGVVAQRLLRTLCNRCKQEYEPDMKQLEMLNIAHLAGKIPFYKPKGCSQCMDRGYFGRTAVIELMPMTDQMARLTLSRPTSDQIKDIAIENGMKTLMDHAVEKLIAGITTIDEVRRKVLFDDTKNL
ncbi:MAG: GspE/PulE family protein, partial [Armatimonadota bacterium]